MRIVTAVAALLSVATLVSASASISIQDESLYNAKDKSYYHIASATNAITIKANGTLDDAVLQQDVAVFIVLCESKNICALYLNQPAYAGKLADGLNTRHTFTMPGKTPYDIYYTLTTSTKLVPGKGVLFADALALSDLPVKLISPDLSAQADGHFDAAIVDERDTYCVNDVVTVKYDFSKVTRTISRDRPGPLVVLSEIRGENSTDYASETLISLDDLEAESNVLHFNVPETLAGRHGLKIMTSVQWFAGLYNEGEKYVNHGVVGNFSVVSAKDCKVVIKPPPAPVKDCDNSTTTESSTSTTKTVTATATTEETPCSTSTLAGSKGAVTGILASAAASNGFGMLLAIIIASAAASVL